jgi:hypothetical protein
MSESSFFFNARPAYPWSLSSIGLPALAIVAVLLVLFTIWSYTGHPNANRRRITTVLALRVLALVVALLTAVRPSIGVQENPKLPSVLLIGVDTSESMTVKDEVNNQSRIEAVRKTLDRCQPLLDDLAAEQHVTIELYKFSTADFSPGANKYTPGDPADGKRSDYGTYLNRTFDRWQNERFMRGHILIGDGGDNGEAYSAIAEAARWGRRNCPITTFTVGSDNSQPNVSDIIVTSVECEPSPVPIKTEFTVVGTVQAYGFVGTRVAARVSIDGKVVATEPVTLDKEKDNKVRITIKAPQDRGEKKVKLEVGQQLDSDGSIVALKGESRDDNNYSETYLTVTKDGVRVLIIDRLRWEETRLRDALRSEKRFDVNEVVRQTDGDASPGAEELLDLDSQAYDVVIIGNVSPAQLPFKRGGRTISVLEKIRERVQKNGMGLMFLGGEHALAGMPADLLPVTVPPPIAGPNGSLSAIVDNLTDDRPNSYYLTIPTEPGLAKMMKLSKEMNETVELWGELNTFKRGKGVPGITGYNKMTKKPTATVYAWAAPSSFTAPPTAGTSQPANADPLLVGYQLDDGARGRVLALAAYDTYLWERLGQPKTRQGSEIHTRFWRQCVLWLAHQDEEEGQAYARPLYRQLKVGAEQSIRVGVKLPSGQEDPNAELTVKIVPMPKTAVKTGDDANANAREPDLVDIEKARTETIVRDKDGAKVMFRPRERGEYFVLLTSPKKDVQGNPVLNAEGKPVLLRATAKFIAVPDTSDEMLRVNADHDFMTRLAVQSGGKAMRLDDLPGFLKELKAEPMSTLVPKPHYYPDWRRNHSKGFLPLWLVIFALLLGVEWGLRRLWGMV